MPKKYKLPNSVRPSEELGFHLVFQEVMIRGTTDIGYQVVVQEEGLNQFEVIQIYTFKSWDDMKVHYPTIRDFLQELSRNQHWDSSWRSYDRIYFIQTCIGHEGLYEIKRTVWFDAKS